MDKLIQDITPVETPAYLRGYGQKTQAKRLTTEVMVEELFHRGVTIEDIFGQFYAMEAMADARHDEIFGNDEEGQHGDPNRFKPKPLTVGDAELAGVLARDLPVVPKNGQPF